MKNIESLALEQMSAAELGSVVNNKQISPTEVVRYFADRIAENNARTNAFVYVKIEEAMEEAKRIENLIARGKEVGPFAGVPFGLKDFLPSKKGWTNTHGGVESLTAVDTANSVFCEAMEEAGGIAIGKTNAPAFGFRGTTDNKLYGPTKNPFNTEYNAGGSSGGSAAAVADELVPIAEGGDAGGSIRIPAAWCNCFGFKASFGSIPNVNRPDAWSATHPYCTPGGITKTVEDAAILLNYMSRYDSRDPLSAPFVRPDYTSCLNRPINDLRIGFTFDFNLFPVDPEIMNRVYQATGALQRSDITHVKFDFTPFTLDDLAAQWCTSICVDSAIEDMLSVYEKDSPIVDPKDLPDAFKYWNKKAQGSTLSEYYNFHCARTKVLDEIENALYKYDIIISPTSCCLPVKNSKDTVGPEMINGTPVNSLIGFAQTFLFNFTGHPAASVPIGLSDSGLPIGMQIIGRRYHDEDVLRVASIMEENLPWRELYERRF